MCECQIGGKIDYRKTNFDILPRIDMISKKLGDSVWHPEVLLAHVVLQLVLLSYDFLDEDQGSGVHVHQVILVDMKTTSLVFIQSAIGQESQLQDHVCKKDFWMSNAIA